MSDFKLQKQMATRRYTCSSFVKGMNLNIEVIQEERVKGVTTQTHKDILKPVIASYTFPVWPKVAFPCTNS